MERVRLQGGSMRRILGAALIVAAAIELVCVGALALCLFGVLATTLSKPGIVGSMLLCVTFASAVAVGGIRLWRSSGAA